jgi:GTP-binding protein EngB required for normal cell division
LTTNGLQQLGSHEHTEIVDLIEKMRDSSVSKYINLPQLAVCGDQSSGKSSVLQAVAEIPFPHSSAQCTRFATEVIMRRSPFENIAISINSYRPESRTPALKAKQESFEAHPKSIGGLADLIKGAGDLMDFSGGSGGFSRDVLQIEISGPTRTPLVLVDLPGLIHTGDDATVVSDLVEEYMRNPRTIILAVVTSSSDPELQIILKKAKDFDPEGMRTLGIITKPDKLEKDSDLEKRFVRLAKNLDKTTRFHLGWHILMNGSPKDGEVLIDFAKRGENEKRFFSIGPWAGISKKSVAVGQLRLRLSNLLLNHVKQELKDVKGEIDAAIADCKEELAEMGDLLLDIESQRRCLTKIGKRYHRLCMEAVWGRYEDARFFGTGFSSEYDSRYLRAVIRNYNEEFAHIFWRYGHSIEVEGARLAPPDDGGGEETSRFDSCLESAEELTRDAAVIEWAKPVTRRARGDEVGDNRNPWLVKLFFCEQSKKWETLAEKQVNDCAAACRKFLRLVLEEVAPLEMQDPLHEWIDSKMDEKLANAKRELRQISNDCQSRQPIINDYQYRANVNIARAKRAASERRIDVPAVIQSLLSSATAGELPDVTELDSVFSIKQITDFLNSWDSGENSYADDNEDARCRASLDEMLAYYRGARTRFVDDVVVQVIERHLVGELCDIFSPSDVSEMSESEVTNIAEESPMKLAKRKELDDKLKELKDGAAICRRHGRHVPARWVHYYLFIDGTSTANCVRST